MGALAIYGGAMIVPRTSDAAHSDTNVVVFDVPGAVEHTAANGRQYTETTFNSSESVSLTPPSGLLDELSYSLQLATAKPEPVRAQSSPLAFIWNERYFQAVAPANPAFDVTNEDAVRERAMRSTIKYLIDEEHMDDFGVNSVTIRPVSADTDSDLLHVDPDARWVCEVAGVTGTGAAMSFPVVLNVDGRTYVDPRVHV